MFGWTAFSQLAMSVPSTSVALDAVFRRQRLDHPAAGAEQRARRDDMVAGLQAAQDRRRHGRHARCHCAGVFRTFQRAHALLEHVDGRVGVARIDEAGLLALEARLGGFGGLVDIALRQVDRFRRLAVLGAQRARMHELGCRLPIALLGHDMPQTTKKPAAKVATGPYGLAARRSFSDLFNVAASRPAKSPRDNEPFRPVPGLRQSRPIAKPLGQRGLPWPKPAFGPGHA